MVLMGIVGELGQGKTLGLSYLAWNNHYYKDRRIFANYNLYGFKYTPVKTLEDLQAMIPMKTPTLEELIDIKEIFFAGDELWRWIDSRCALLGLSKRKTKRISNKIITDILLASRKAFVTIAYTSQSFGQVDKRIRQITDFVCYPQMSLDNERTTMTIFKGSVARPYTSIPPIRFFNEPIFAIYNTYERIEELREGEISEEEFHELEENPAWVKYLMDRGFDKKRIKKECESIQKMIKKQSS